MLTLTTATYQAMLARSVKTFYLYELDYDPNSDPFYWTSWSESISYGGNTYVPFTVKHGNVSQEVNGKISGTTLIVGNIDESRTIQNIIENYNVLGNTIVIRQFFFNSLNQLINDPISVSFKIESAVATYGQVSFSLSIGFDFLLAYLPSRTMHQRFCRWRVFKGTECKYAGADTTCEMLWEDCVSKGNTLNFGGFPGILNHVFYF